MKCQFVPEHSVRKFCTNNRNGGETHHPSKQYKQGNTNLAKLASHQMLATCNCVPLAQLCPTQHSYSSEQNVNIQEQISFYFIQSTGIWFFCYIISVFSKAVCPVPKILPADSPPGPLAPPHMRHRIGPTILYATVLSCINSRNNGISYLETAYIFIPNKQHIYISVRNFCTQKQFPIACSVWAFYALHNLQIF